MNNAVVFFTDDEPDSDVFGKRRHWFGKPSMRGYRISTPGQPVQRNSHDAAMYGSHNGFFGNRGDEVLGKHPEIAPLLKVIYEAT
jgi:hypothetical protein